MWTSSGGHYAADHSIQRDPVRTQVRPRASSAQNPPMTPPSSEHRQSPCDGHTAPRIVVLVTPPTHLLLSTASRDSRHCPPCCASTLHRSSCLRAFAHTVASAQNLSAHLFPGAGSLSPSVPPPQKGSLGHHPLCNSPSLSLRSHLAHSETILLVYWFSCLLSTFSTRLSLLRTQHVFAVCPAPRTGSGTE